MYLVFNCYCHWAILIVPSPDRVSLFIFSMEQVTQGDSLAIMAYIISVLSLIRHPKADFPSVEQPSYVDNAKAGGIFTALQAYTARLGEVGPPRNYFSDPIKSIPVPLR